MKKIIREEKVFDIRFYPKIIDSISYFDRRKISIRMGFMNHLQASIFERRHE